MGLQKVRKLDVHIFLFVVFFILFAVFVFYLRENSGGAYLVEKYKYHADQIALGIDILSASEEDINVLTTAYRKAIAKNPHAPLSAQIHLTLSQIFFSRQNYDEALAELKQVIQNFSTNNQIAGEAKFRIGQVYEKQGNWSEALKSYNEIIELNTFSQKGLLAPLYIAEYYKKEGQLREATAAYDSALKHYRRQLDKLGDISQSAVLLNFIALTYASQGLWEKAVDEWQVMVDRYPKSTLIPATLLAMGEAYAVRLKERSLGAGCYLKLINQYVGSKYALQAKIRLIQLYFFTSDFEEARTWCQRVLEEEAQNMSLRAEVSLILARTYEKEGKWEEAERLYDQVVADYPGTLAALRVPIIKAKHFEGEENYEAANKIYGEALLDFQRLINEEDDQTLVINAQDLMGITYVSQGDWEGLIRHLNQMLKTTENVGRRAQLLFLEADILATKLNKATDAIGLYENFILQYPDHPLVEYATQKLEALKLQQRTLLDSHTTK